MKFISTIQIIHLLCTVTELFQKISKMLGLLFQDVSKFGESYLSFQLREPFDVVDVRDLIENVKHMNIVALAQVSHFM
jgi:hypothetical protein